jgi:hypothetical protein
VVKPDTENIVAEDGWRTIKRVLPRDVYLELIRFESVVAQEIGCGETSIGGSVQVWSVITHVLREHEAELIQSAKDWKEPEGEN